MAIETPNDMKTKTKSTPKPKKLTNKQRNKIMEDLVRRNASFIEMLEALPPRRKAPKGNLIKKYYEDYGKRHGY